MKITRRIVLVGLAAVAACSASKAPPDSASVPDVSVLDAAVAATTTSSDAITAPLAGAQLTGLLAFRDSVWHAWFAGDTAFLRRALPSDFMSIPFGDDTTWANQDQTIAAAAEYAASGGKLTKLEFPRTVVQVAGNAAILLTTYRMELENGGKRSTSAGRGTEMFVRKDGRWLHPSWHLDSGR